MPPLKSGRSRLAIGCAVVAMATAVTGPAWAEPAPSFEALLERIGLQKLDGKLAQLLGNQRIPGKRAVPRIFVD